MFTDLQIVAPTKKRGSKSRNFRTARPPKGARSDQKGDPKGSPFQVLGVARAPNLAANPVHVASLMDLCHLKQAELDKHFQKETGRVVLLGDIAKDDEINQAVFTERGQSITFSDGCSNFLSFWRDGLCIWITDPGSHKLDVQKNTDCSFSGHCRRRGTIS